MAMTERIPTERHLSKREIADSLNVSIRTINRYMAAGHLRYIKTPTGIVRFPESELTRITELRGAA